MKNFSFIAELCCNHNGSLETCKKMIDELKSAGVKIIKLQKRDNDLWLKHKPDLFSNPHPNPANSYGKNYYEHRKFLELSIQQHKEIKYYCESLNLKYGCSVFDIPSAKEIIKLSPDFIKIPSPSNNNFELIDYVYKNYFGEVHISFGMTTKSETEQIFKRIKKNRAFKRTVLFVATSGYPVMPKDANLMEITKFAKRYSKKYKGIGYSGHHEGICLDLLAFSLGANYIERHITLNRSQKGTDHKVAVLPKEVKTLLLNIKDAKEALNFRKQEIMEIEYNNRRKLKWNS